MVVGPVRGVCVTMPTPKSSCAGPTWSEGPSCSLDLAAGNGLVEKRADFPALCYTRPRRPRLEFWYAATTERSCRSAAG